MHTRALALALVLTTALVSLLSPSSLAAAPERDWPVTFAPFTGVHATLLAPTLRLRQQPVAGSPLVATVRKVEDDGLRVTAISGDFVRVDYRGRDGWASLADVAPDGMALVIDPATGAVAGRVPIEPYQTDVVFSPDGSHALFFGPSYDDRPVATEVRMSDLAPVRTVLLPPVDEEVPNQLCDLFYGSDNAVYAAVSRVTDEESRVAVVRVRDAGAPAEAPAFEASGLLLRVAADGKTGLVQHDVAYSEDWVAQGVTLDVVNMDDFSIRSTFTLTGDAAAASGGYPALNHDGSEVYLLDDTSRVVVVDTATGKVVREVATGFARVEDAGLFNGCTGGRSLLVWAEGCVENAPEGSVWIDGAKRATAPRSIVCAADAGVARYGVDADGARLFTFGANARATRTTKIARPESRRANAMLFPSALVASPDGSRLVFIVAVPHEDCPC